MVRQSEISKYYLNSAKEEAQLGADLQPKRRGMLVGT